MKILFLVPYPYDEAASQRFRFEEYFSVLEEHQIDYDYHSFLDAETWRILYAKGYVFKKILGIASGFIRRIYSAIISVRYDYVFVHREVTPIGPPIFEWIISKILKRKIIYDFDDAIWMVDKGTTNHVMQWLKNYGKIGKICQWSDKVSCGNQYLATYAKQFNKTVVINPTTIDTINKHIPIKKNNKIPIIGWTGTHSTNKYLQLLKPTISRLSVQYQFRFIVISNEKPSLDLINMEFIEWNKDTEIDDLNLIDIGLMPLRDDEWAKGKCGFKALQYMSLEIPALVSPVGVNNEIITHGEEGYHCGSDEDWFTYIALLLENPDLRYQMGIKGRKKIERKYSVLSNSQNFLNLFSYN